MEIGTVLIVSISSVSAVGVAISAYYDVLSYRRLKAMVMNRREIEEDTGLD